MNERSKMLRLIKIIMIIIVVFIILLILVLFNRCSKSIDNTTLGETTQEVQEKIIFNFNKSPKEQKNKLKGHESEYEEQLYRYIFNDEKMVNAGKLSRTSSYEAIIGFGEVKDIISIYSKEPLKSVIKMIFSTDEIDYEKYPFTDNYIKNHPVSLKKEFKDYFKEDYEKVKDNGKFKYLYIYYYNIGIDREKQQVEIEVDKSIEYYDEEMGVDGGVVYGKKGSKYEGQELYITLRKIYFDYKLDEKEYLDDIKYSNTQIINDEKEFDDSCPEYH